MSTKYVIRAEDTGSQVVDGELLVINFETSFFYGLNRTATAVWNVLDSPRSASALAELLAGPFDADTETIGADIERLLSELVEEGLVVEEEAAADGPVPTIDIADGGWEPPSIERYERLDQLILSGE